MRTPRAAGVLLATAIVAGCGGGGHNAGPKNGEASKPPAKVLADAQHAATGASSVHVAGSILSQGTPVTLDVTIARGKGAKGSMSTNGLQFDLVRIDDKVYIRGSDAFYRHFAGKAVAQLLHGKWLEGSATQGKLRSLSLLTNTSVLFAKIASGHGKLANDGETTYKGQDVVEIRDQSDNSKLYVAARGKPYPVAIVGGKSSQSGTIAFDRWNQPVSLSAPKGAIPIPKLGTG